MQDGKDTLELYALPSVFASSTTKMIALGDNQLAQDVSSRTLACSMRTSQGILDDFPRPQPGKVALVLLLRAVANSRKRAPEAEGGEVAWDGGHAANFQRGGPDQNGGEC
jgi:hypothetical protein